MRMNLGTTPRTRATATIEMAIMLPAYLLMFFGLVYLGWATIGAFRQQPAAAYVALQTGAQRADEMMTTFYSPWITSVDQTSSVQGGGSEAVSGDTTLRVWDNLVTTDAFPQTNVDAALYGMALGSLTIHTSIPFGGGAPQATLVEHVTDAGRYLRSNDITSIPSTYRPSGPLRVTGVGGNVLSEAAQPPPAGSTKYTTAVARAVNASTIEGNWLEQRQAHVEYSYAPPFLQRIGVVQTGPTQTGAPRLTKDQFLAGGSPEGGVAMVFPSDCRTTSRGAAERLGARDPNASPDTVMQQMYALLGAPVLAPPVLSDDDSRFKVPQ